MIVGVIANIEYNDIKKNRVKAAVSNKNGKKGKKNRTESTE